MSKILQRLLCKPFRGKDVYIADSAIVIGDVRLHNDVSIWHGAILRADIDSITIGDESNIQDGSILHVTNNKWPVKIGKRVTIGHGVKLHGCTIYDNVLVGIGAIILDGAIINSNCIIAAGSLVPPGKEIPEGSMVMGSPAKIVRQLEDKDIEMIRNNALHYVEYKKIYIENGIGGSMLNFV